jgi:hypothetical protein
MALGAARGRFARHGRARGHCPARCARPGAAGCGRRSGGDSHPGENVFDEQREVFAPLAQGRQLDAQQPVVQVLAKLPRPDLGREIAACARDDADIDGERLGVPDRLHLLAVAEAQEHRLQHLRNLAEGIANCGHSSAARTGSGKPAEAVRSIVFRYASSHRSSAAHSPAQEPRASSVLQGGQTSFGRRPNT